MVNQLYTRILKHLERVPGVHIVASGDNKPDTIDYGDLHVPVNYRGIVVSFDEVKIGKILGVIPVKMPVNDLEGVVEALAVHPRVGRPASECEKHGLGYVRVRGSETDRFSKVIDAVVVSTESTLLGCLFSDGCATCYPEAFFEDLSRVIKSRR